MFNYCTLFDSGYLDRGIVLYESLEKLSDDFCLYILAFDHVTENVLRKMSLQHAVIISLTDFETPQLSEKKSERTRAEYCWTCTPHLIMYVLDTYDVDMCTYIDADMMFFSSVEPLFRKMKDANASIIITPHRFEDSLKGEKAERRAGKYCVEFNTFINNDTGRLALEWWCDRCLEWCSFKRDGKGLGDQKYLEEFPTLFEGIWINDHFGAGVAPWNLSQYELAVEHPSIIISERASGRHLPLIFYHYQNLRFISEYIVNCNSLTRDVKIKKALYIPYLRNILIVRKMLLDNYGIKIVVNRAISKNPIIAFIQDKIMPYRVRTLSDVINMQKESLNDEECC